MATAPHTLQIGAAPARPLAALGITAATTMHGNLAVDTLTLATAARVDAAPLIAAYEKAILRDATGAIRFVGWLDRPRRAVQGGKHGWEYILSGPMRWLVREPYRVLRWTLEGLKGCGITTLGSKTTYATGANPVARTTQISLNEQLAAAIDVAIAAGAPITRQITSADVAKIPWERRLNDSCAGVLRALLQWSPQIVGRWSLGEGTCQLRLVDTGPERTCSEQLKLRAADLTPRYDDLYGRVTIDFIYRLNQKEAPESLQPFVPEIVRTITADAGPDGTALGAPTLYRAIELQSGEPPPTDEDGRTIAEAVAEYVGQLRHDAQFTCHAIHWERAPGDRWSWAGVLAGPGSYSVCQTITRDLLADTETIAVGSPKHLGIDNFLALWKSRAHQGDGSAPSDPDNGGAGKSGQQATANGFGSVKVQLAPAAVRENGGGWFLPGRPVKKDGETLQAVPAGEVTVEFSEVPGWQKPPPVTVTVADGASAEVPEESGTYTQPPLGPFQLRGYSKTQVRWGRSTCNGEPLPEWDEDDIGNPNLINPGTGSGVAWIKVSVNGSGDITFTAGAGATMPGDSTDTLKYQLIGSYARTVREDGVVIWECHNDAFGPLVAEACRNHYEAEESYRVFVQAAGGGIFAE